ncbi:hypothetical protein WJX72_002804 [[Myrmecia] bisecta]|uniref:DUF221-domain-containing protein n=1 Tax=[Myrmecia] bisecta TaxID=41462 RepID=A0AAW1QEH2_9CHLO
MATDGKAFGIAIAIDFVICLCILLAFNFIRKLFEKYYAPKSFAEGNTLKHVKLSFFGWIGPTWSYSHEEVVKAAGMDAAMYLRVLRFGIELFALITFWCCAVVLPVNLALGTFVDESTQAGSSSSYTFTNLDKTSISNIQPSSKALWTHAVSAYVVTFIVFYLLWKYNKEAVMMRIDYLNTLKKGAESHTVLVNDIPGIYKGAEKIAALARGAAKKGTAKMSKRTRQDRRTDDSAADPSDFPAGGDSDLEVGERLPVKGMVNEEEPLLPAFDATVKAERMLNAGFSEHDMVEQEFKEQFPNEVAEVAMVVDQSALDKLVSAYDRAKAKLENVLDGYQYKLAHDKKIKKRQTVRVIGARYGKWGLDNYGKTPKKVDALKFYPARLRALLPQIKEAQAKASEQALPSAFVTFKDRHTQVVASTSMIHHDRRYWSTEAAPAPKDTIYANLGMRGYQRQLRFFISWAIFFTIASFYLIPVAAIQAVLEIERLSKIVPFKQLVSVSFVRSILTAVLPGLALTIFMALLPIILSAVNRKVEKMPSETAVDFGVVRKFFAFQVITTFLGSLLAGSFFTQFSQYFDNLSGLVNTMGSAAPQTATFFMTFILVQAFITQPISLLRIVGLVLYWLRLKFATTDRQKQRVWQDQETKYGTLVAGNTIALLLGLVFCIIQPLITPITLIYFLVTSLIWKYQMVYVYVPTRQSGGKLWAQVFQHVITALVIFQIIMIGLLGIKKSGAAGICVVLPILTVIFTIVNRKLFIQPQVILSMRGAADSDKRDASMANQGEHEDFESYTSPAFKDHTDEVEALLGETASVDRKLKALGLGNKQGRDPAGSIESRAWWLVP